MALPGPPPPGEEVPDLLHGTERDQVPQPLVDREEAEPLPAALRREDAVQLIAFESAGEEVTVVEKGVFDARPRQIGGEIGFPDAFGEPEAGGLDPEPAAEVRPHPLDLLHPVRRGERREDGLVASGGKELDAALRRPRPEVIEEVRGVVLDPVEKGT